MSATYADVDGSPDPAYAVASQEVVDSWPDVQVYKQHTRHLLAGCGPVLDVGCGPGLDLVEQGRGTAVGVDASLAMCLTARARAGPCVAAGEGSALPFADESFGGVRADRVLQHLAHPVACLREMARVCRPGGRLVIADPDQETLVISVPGVPPALTDRVKALRRDIGYRNGRFVTTLPEELDRMGFVDIATRAFPLVLTRADLAFGLPGWPRLWQREGGFTDEEIVRWERAVAQSPIVYALLYFTVAATKP
ncbi:MAG TPA: methyltransferase domain-containing protein [Acidimicrobiales bacterium]|nr:methyltransferase domain-containing protein [Acidimicrobiales bacterium]